MGRGKGEKCSTNQMPVVPEPKYTHQHGVGETAGAYFLAYISRSLGWLAERRGAVGKGRPILTDRQLAHALRWRSAAAGRSAASASPKTVKNEASSIPPEIFSGIHMNSQEFPSCREGELD